MRYQRPGINIIDRYYLLCFKIFLQRCISHKAAVFLFQVAAYYSLYFYTIAFYIASLYTIITNVHTIHDQYLAIITGVGKYFLVTGHSGIKTNFTGGGTNFTKGFAIKNIAIFKN